MSNGPSTAATRASLGGAGVLMACACASGSVATLLVVAGIAATATIVQPMFAVLGAALVLYGLARIRRESALLAAGGFAVLAAAALLTPPSLMTLPGDGMQKAGQMGLPWHGPQLLGAALYVVSLGMIAYAFWRAYPSRKPSASATAMGGVVLATGCTACCMVTGAVAGIALSLGFTAVNVETVPLVFWTGLTLAAIGLYRLGGWRPVAWVAVGGLITPAGKIAYTLYPKALNMSGLWVTHGVDLVFIPKYFTYFFGALIILYAFVVAYHRAQASAVGEADVIPIREFELDRMAVGAD